MYTCITRSFNWEEWTIETTSDNEQIVVFMQQFIPDPHYHNDLVSHTFSACMHMTAIEKVHVLIMAPNSVTAHTCTNNYTVQ